MHQCATKLEWREVERMDKQKLVACLVEKGYETEVVESIPYIRINCKSDKEFQKKYKELGNELKELGYDSSFGAKAVFN